MRHMTRRLPIVLAVAAVFVLVSGCGRVNLEDLTPEAIRTEIASRPTATPAPSPSPGGGPTPTPGGDETPVATARTGTGNLAAGASLYNAQCSGCHGSDGQPGRRAASLHGTELTFDDARWLLTGDGAPDGHPTYANITVPLSENNLEDIFFYLQSQ